MSTVTFSCGNVTFSFDIWYKNVYFWSERTVLVLVLVTVVLVSVLVLPVPVLVLVLKAMVLALVLVLPLLVLTASPILRWGRGNSPKTADLPLNVTRNTVWRTQRIGILERFVAFKIRQNAFPTGVSPPLGAHDAPPDSLIAWVWDTPPITSYDFSAFCAWWGMPQYSRLEPPFPFRASNRVQDVRGDRFLKLKSCGH